MTVSLMPAAASTWRLLGMRDTEFSLRKLHTAEVPRVGGLVVIGSVAAVSVVRLFGVLPSPLTGALLGSLIVGAVGLWDDIAGLKPKTKLAVQVVATAVAMLCGLHWPGAEASLGSWLAIPLTFGFVLAVTNGLNLIDGLDGLAGGMASIGFAVVMVSIIAIAPQNPATTWITAATLGSLLAFLVHNRHPARVFLGDSGAYALGFLLACLLLLHPPRAQAGAGQLSVPILASAVPLLDLGFAVVRRWIRGQSIVVSDADHLHHRLRARGLGHREAVRRLWICSGLFAGVAMFIVLDMPTVWIISGLVAAAVTSAILLGLHRILARLVRWRDLSWPDRRRRTRSMFAKLSELEGRLGPSRDQARWIAATPGVLSVLDQVGVLGLEVHRPTGAVVRAGAREGAWAWLGLPIPDRELEVRVFLATRLPDLSSEHVAVLEESIRVLVGPKPLAVAPSEDELEPAPRAA